MKWIIAVGICLLLAGCDMNLPLTMGTDEFCQSHGFDFSFGGHTECYATGYCKSIYAFCGNGNKTKPLNQTAICYKDNYECQRLKKLYNIE